MNIKLQTLSKKYMDYQYESRLKDKNNYIEYLKESKNKNQDERNALWAKYKNPYIDIDGDYRKDRKDHSNFYSDLCLYLNKQEERLITEDRWHYDLSWDGIIAKNDKIELCLRSDLFGFSAPQIKTKDNRYPYNYYLNTIGKEETVADIIWNTRSLGGSFLWPVVKTNGELRSTFNMNRGVKSYIYDRVDLTLFEIRVFYSFLKIFKHFEVIKNEMKHKGFILLKGNDANAIYEWLKHFRTFQTYVEYFSFQDFVKDKRRNIINIANNKILKYPQNKEKVPEIPDLSPKEIEYMLLNVNNKILKRTRTMVDVINHYQIKVIGLGEETFESLRYVFSKSKLTYGHKIYPCIFNESIDNNIIDMSMKLGSANPVNIIENKKDIKEITADSDAVVTICKDNELDSTILLNKMPSFLEYSKRNGAISIGIVLLSDENILKVKSIKNKIKKMREFADIVLVLPRDKYSKDSRKNSLKKENEDIGNFIRMIEEIVATYALDSSKQVLQGKNRTFYLTCEESGKYRVTKAKKTIIDLIKETNITKAESMIIVVESNNLDAKDAITIVEKIAKVYCKNKKVAYRILEDDSLKNSVKVSIIANN